MKQIFLADCDDVLLNWSVAFCEFMEINHPEYKIDRSTYSLGLDLKTRTKFIELFNQSPEFAKIQPYPQAIEYVKKIQQLGFKFVVISTCLGSNYTRIMREQNLEKVFGKDVFKAIHCLPLYTSKKSTLAKYKPTYWVDDKLSHCIDGSLVGHTVFEMIQSHSPKEERPKSVTSVKSWQEIYEKILANSTTK